MYKRQIVDNAILSLKAGSSESLSSSSSSSSSSGSVGASHASQLETFPLDVHSEIHKFFQPVDKQALAATCRSFKKLDLAITLIQMNSGDINKFKDIVNTVINSVVTYPKDHQDVFDFTKSATYESIITAEKMQARYSHSVFVIKCLIKVMDGVSQLLFNKVNNQSGSVDISQYENSTKFALDVNKHFFYRVSEFDEILKPYRDLIKRAYYEFCDKDTIGESGRSCVFNIFQRCNVRELVPLVLGVHPPPISPVQIEKFVNALAKHINGSAAPKRKRRRLDNRFKSLKTSRNLDFDLDSPPRLPSLPPWLSHSL